MKKEKVKYVEKKWGSEVWLVNSEYCGKLLHLDKGAVCSYHYHPCKEETFFILSGKVRLTVEDKEYILTTETSPITISPGDAHKFYGIEKSAILEISSHHSDKDVVRIESSISSTS